jgi:hypothetical protein
MSSDAALNLWNQNLGRVPDSVWRQTDLETLILAGNNLEALSEQSPTRCAAPRPDSRARRAAREAACR